MIKQNNNKIEREINPKTGRPYSNTTIWRHSNSPKAKVYVEKQREKMRTVEEIEKAIIRSMVNREGHSETKRLYYQKNKLRMANKTRLRMLNHPKIIKAHNDTTWNYEKKECCEICGSKERLQAHHWNYEKPLMVNTLCRDCHEIQHTKNFERWQRCRIEADKQLNTIEVIN